MDESASGVTTYCVTNTVGTVTFKIDTDPREPSCPAPCPMPGPEPLPEPESLVTSILGFLIIWRLIRVRFKREQMLWESMRTYIRSR
jgi:hypothetical protein